MKKILAILILFAVPAFGSDQFRYRCLADEGDAREIQVCRLIITAFVTSGVTSEYKDGNYSWYGVSIIPQQHSDGIGCSASISIDYYTKACGDILISVGTNVVLIESEDEYTKETFDGVVANACGLISEWKANALPVIATHCNSNRVKIAADMEGF